VRTWPSSENLPTVKRKASHQRQPIEVQNGGNLVEQHGVVNRSQGRLRSRRRGAVWRGSGSCTLLGRVGIVGLLLLEGQELEGVIRSFLNAGVSHRLGLGGSSHGTRWRARGSPRHWAREGGGTTRERRAWGEALTRGWSRGSSGSRSGEKLSLLLP
jgi:hypothetical protein